MTRIEMMLNKEQQDAHENNPLCPPYFKGEIIHITRMTQPAENSCGRLPKPLLFRLAK
jgi:hypothetical protein